MYERRLHVKPLQRMRAAHRPWMFCGCFEKKYFCLLKLPLVDRRCVVFLAGLHDAGRPLWLMQAVRIVLGLEAVRMAWSEVRPVFALEITAHEVRGIELQALEIGIDVRPRHSH